MTSQPPFAPISAMPAPMTPQQLDKFVTEHVKEAIALVRTL